MLAERGSEVVVNGLGGKEEITAAVEECRGAGGESCRVENHRADLTVPSQIASMFEFAEDKFGRTPDILVNNAGIQYVAPIEDFPNNMYDKILAINLSAAFHTSKLAVTGMKERGWGRIINIASAHGLVASVNKSAYIAAKSGLVGLTKAVAVETAGTGVTYNAIAPGGVLTPLAIPQIETIAQAHSITFEEAMIKGISEKHPSGQFVMSEEIAELVLYLCTDAARQITGSTLSIDGGWTAV